MLSTFRVAQICQRFAIDDNRFGIQQNIGNSAPVLAFVSPKMVGASLYTHFALLQRTSLSRVKLHLDFAPNDKAVIYALRAVHG